MTLLSITPTTRMYAEQKPGWKRFQSTLTTPTASQQINNQMTQQHQYQRQYSHVYYQRLAMLGPVVWNRIRSCHDDDENVSIVHTKRILELPEDTLCSCVGTLIVERDLTPQPIEDDNVDLITTSPASDKCTYYLEDESGRVALNFSTWWKNHDNASNDPDFASDTGSDDKHSLGGNVHNDTPTDLCTGVVIGLVGVVGVDGVMQVQKVYTAATVQTKQPAIVTGSRNTDPAHPTNASPHILLLSGLDCGSPTTSSLSRDLLISYLQGVFPQQDTKAASIVHVFMAGGLVYSGTDTTSMDESTMITTNGCRDLDIFCYQIAHETGIPITIVPGQNDPTTANWPQRPLHASLIPVTSNSCSSSAILNRCPNPYAATFNLDNVENQRSRYIFGTDGTNVADWTRQAGRNRPASTKGSSSNELHALHATLAHQHLCPTGPDTVPTAPHVEIDPMVMTSTSTHPTLYFAGNCSQFQTKLVTVNVPSSGSDGSTGHDNIETECRLVCIPKFSETSVAVLVNLDTMQVELLKFDATI